jgi:predicted nuclease of predicted toxin-antitoxin system
MKLLFDENISSRLVRLLASEFPDSSHPDFLEMRGFTDTTVWNHAKENDFIIVSKDNDFRQKAFLYGAPPKVIWLSIGNAGTSVIAKLLQDNVQKIQTFVNSQDESLLVLELPKAEEASTQTEKSESKPSS